MNDRTDTTIGRALVLDELFDLALYRTLRRIAAGDLARMLDEMIAIESKHVAFWKRFFGLDLDALDWRRRVKLAILTTICRVVGAPAIQLVLEAIEVYGVRKYLRPPSKPGDRGPALVEPC